MSFCRITGRSRGLPKPNYFPLLAPISPADAKRCCRITGKSYGLPSHHYIPVLLAARSGKANKCKITNVSGELGPHHYSPEINYGNRKHEMLADYRYIFPVLDGTTDAQRGFMEMLLTKQVADDKRYVYTVQEKRCSLVFSARMEAAVRDGDVRDVMLAKDSDTLLVKTKHGRSVSMDFKDFTDEVEMFEGEGPNAEVLKQREFEELEDRKKKRKRAAGLSSMKKIFENKERLAEVQEIEEEKMRQDREAKKAKLDETRHEKHDIKSFSCNNFDLHHMRSKSSIVMCNSEWRDQMHPLIETWDWDLFEKEVNNELFTPKVTTLPSPLNLTPYHCDTQIHEVDRNISEVTIPLENVPCVNPLKPIKSRPSEEVLNAVAELSEDRLLETSNITEKLLNSDKVDMLPTLDILAEVVKNIKKGKKEKIAKISGLTLDINKAKKFIPGQHINTPQGSVFVPGQTVETPTGLVFVPGLSVNTPAGSGLIPGHIINNENTNEAFFLAGQVLQTENGNEFVCGQTIKTKNETCRFIEGQTVLSEEGFKFVPGKVISNGSEEVFVPGQTIMTPDGVKFIPGQTVTENGNIVFTPGQNAKINNEWQFVPGQVVHQEDELQFVPGATLSTPNGLKFVPGQTVITNGETIFVPGVIKMGSNGPQFVPGTTVETIDGPKFIEGQVVNTDCGEKFIPGKTIVQANGHVEFSVAKRMEDITFTESMPVGLPIDIKTCSLSEESLYVFGHMVQSNKGIEFYPGPKAPALDGKVVPGRLVKNEANQSRFVPGMMVEGVFVPGQIVFTENGEQFVPGQVVDTTDGPKFVPGQVVNTKSGPKFVPGQTIHTIDGPRFVPGQIIETKAGPTFIPGQVIFTEDEGSRFVPGQVVDTDEGPRFVPGRVIETDDQGVTFVPGQIVQTPEGLKFVAPDLIEGEEGFEFSVQSFVVTPEELKLLKVKTNPNDTSSTKGELTIDRKMLRQLSEAGMSIGRQVPTDLPAISVILNHTKNTEALKAFVTDFGLKDDVANQLMEVITSIIEMSSHLKSEIQINHKNNGLIKESKRNKANKKRLEVQDNFDGDKEQHAHQEKVKNSIAAAVLAALVTAEQFEEINNNNGKEKYQHILKSIDTILGKTIDEDFVSAMYKILQTEENKEILCEEILENSTNSKVELIKIAINNAVDKHTYTQEDIIDKFSDFLSSESQVLGPAFKNISKNDTNLFQHVLGRISDSISFIKTDHEAAETLQKAIVSAVQEISSISLKTIFEDSNKEMLKELIVQSVGLAIVLGLSDVAKSLLCFLNDEHCLTKIENDEMCMNILKRLTVMRKLAEHTPSLHSALRKLETDPELARTDPKVRDLVRESAALMIVPEESPLMTSDDIPLSLLHPENSLAMEDFLFQRKKLPGALLIMKKGLQAVVPREASRAVLTGQVAYTVLDENGIRHFEPLHVFSALNLSQPTAHRFSMYSCPILDDNDEDLQTFTGYCNISHSQRISKYRNGGYNRKYNGVLLDRENTRSRMNSLDYTPSYKRYHSPSLSSTRSRSTCSRSPSKVDDIVVATSDYTASADDEVSLKAGDIVEVLDTKAALGSKNPPTDSELDVKADLLDATAAKHKLAVRPKKKHASKLVKRCSTSNERWLVRVVEDVQGDELCTRQGYVPAHVLKEKLPERDQTALAARRQAVVRELIETEEEFGRDMRQVVAQYMRPMDKASTPKPVFDNRELLFSNFKQICEFHNTGLLEGIKYYAEEPRMLGRALLRMEREFDKHVAYCRDEPRAQQLLKNDPVVSKYFKVLAEKVGDDKGLTEHLKLPIQRINDYQLLLKELVKYSKRLGDDCTDLQKALELFLGVPNRATNNLFIDSIEGFRGNIYKLGRLLTHDWFTVDFGDKPENKYVFLFKARILICKVETLGDGRSIFVLKHIVKLPEVELKDLPETTKFELHKKDPPLVITFKATKESVKTAWLREIAHYASDLVALAEHAADDLQVLSPPKEESPEPPEEKRKREASEDNQVEERQEKKSRVEEVVEQVTEVLAEEESLHVSNTKRKASIETDVASKISKTEVTEISISEVQETQSSVSAASEVTTDLESKSIVTQVSEVDSITSHSKVSQETVVQTSDTSVSQVEVQQETASSISVQNSSVEQSNKTEIVKKEKVSKTEVKSKELNSESSISTSQETANLIVQKSSNEQSQLEQEVKAEESTQFKESVSYNRQTSKKSIEKSESVEKSVVQSEVLVENESDSIQQQIITEKVEDSTLETTSNSKVTSPEKTEPLAAKENTSEDKENVNPVSKNTAVISNGVSDSKELLTTKTEESAIESNTTESRESISEKTASTRKSVKSKKVETTGKSVIANTELLENNKVVEEVVNNKNSPINTPIEVKTSNQSAEESSKTGASSDQTVNTGLSEERVLEESQAVITEDNPEGEMSRYSRSSRLSGEYSSSSRKLSSGGRYESNSTYDSTGISSVARRESGSRIESARYESGGTLEGSAASRYESKYSTSNRIEGGSKYGIESSYESKNGSKYAIESSLDVDSKLDSITSKYGLGSETHISGRSSKYSVESNYDGDSDITTKRGSIASKYGIGSNSEVQIEGRSSKYNVEASYDGNSLETSSKLDSIASKYGLGSNETKTEGLSSKYSVETSYDGNGVDTISKIDSIASKYGRNSITDSAKIESRSTKLSVGTNFDGKVNGESIIESKYRSKKEEASESKYSKKSILSNGSVTGEYESTKTISRSESDGKPIFTKTLEGQNIEPGENAVFEVAVEDCPDEIQVTWLKDNKPFNDRLMDRVNMIVNNGTYRLQVMHCREDDSGTYTAIAENVKGNAHCTAQLAVHELTPEERKQKNALNAPYFLVALKDTEILLNTYLRFMVKVKGNPNPEVKFYRDGKEITATDGERLSIVRTRADRGCYELVIADVCADDAGLYSCNAMNIYGDVSTEAKVTVVDDKNIFGELLPGGEGLLAKGEKAAFTWKKDGSDFDPEERFKVLLGDDEDSLALVFQHVKPEDAGLYTCVAKTSTGNISCSAELTVQGAVNYLHREPQKPELVIEHKEAIVSCGGSAMLELVCKGYPKPNVVFKHEGKVVEADARHKFLFEDDENMSLVIKNVTPADAGEYHVIASNDLGEDTTTMNLVVKQAPKIKKKIENQTCMAESTHEVTIEIEGTPSPDVSFYKDGVEIKSSERITIVKESEEIYKIIIKNAKLTDTGSYSVVAKNEVNQCSDFWQWHVTSPPKIIKKLGGDKVCNEKETVTFEVQTEADPAPTVTWYKNKTELKESSAVKITSSGSAHSLVITSAARADSAEYSCEIRNVHGSSSDSCLLNVRCAPQFTKRLQDTTAAEGDVNVEFTVDVDAFPTPDVKWYLGDVEITEKKSVFTRVDSGSSHKLVLNEVTSELSGQYTCKVSNEMGQDSCQATFTVNRKPRITKSLIDMSVDVGQTLKLEVEVEGCPEPRIMWYKDGKEVTTDARIKIERDTKRLENYHLTVTLIKEEDGGEYEVRAENEMGSVSSRSIVTVHTKEVHSRFRKESVVESELEEESKAKKQQIEDVIDDGSKKTAKKLKKEKIEDKSLTDETDTKPKSVSVDEVDKPAPIKPRKSISEPEVIEEKSFWDDIEEPKKPQVDDMTDHEAKKTAKKERSEPELLKQKSIVDEAVSKLVSFEEVEAVPLKSQKSFTEPEVVEEKSFWDDIEENEKPKSAKIDEGKKPVPLKSQKSVTEPEVVEEKSFWDDIEENEKPKSAKIDEGKKPVPLKSQKSVTEPEVVEEKSFWDDIEENEKPKSAKIDEGKKPVPLKSQKSVTEPEVVEEKSFWDDIEENERPKSAKLDEGKKSVPLKSQKSVTEPEVIEEKSIDKIDTKTKSVSIEEIDKPTPVKSQKSFTAPEDIEQKSLWDDIGDNEQPKSVKEGDAKFPKKARKSFTEPEVSESKSIWDENHNDQSKKPIVEEVKTEKQKSKKELSEPEIIKEVPIDESLKSSKRKSVKKQSFSEEPLSAETEGRVFETVTTFKSGDDGSIIVSKVSSSLSHGAIITGPAETRTIHKMTSSAVYYDENDEYDKKIVKPNKPHTTSLEVEEIASHSYYLSELGYYTIPDHIRRGTYGIIEEPQTDSDAETNSKHGKQVGNRTISIKSVSEDEMSWQNDSLSREISIEDLSKCLFDIDDTKKFFSKDSYVRRSSFKEDYFTDEGEEESVILKEQSQKVYENDITEKLIHISKEFDENEFINIEVKIDDIKNRIIEELVLSPTKIFDTITKDIAETTLERKKKASTCLLSVDEEGDRDIEELLKRSQRQRSILDDILNEEDEKAPPKLKESTLKDGHTYESLPLVYTVEASGTPKPTVRWLHEGQEVKPGGRVHITNEGDLYKLEIDAVDMKDAGKWQCEIVNDLGTQSLQAELSVSPESELRKPKFTAPLEATSVMQREPVTMKAVCTADPLPHVAWLLNGEELTPDIATLITSLDSKELEHGLKECIFTLHIPSGRHADTGEYTIQAKNKYGVGECSARLDILLRPEVEPLKDVTTVPFEETSFFTNIRANPVAEVKWSKDGYVIQPSAKHEIIEDREKETFKLVVKNVSIENAGLYTVSAKNEHGETTQQARLNVHTDKPSFIKPLQKQIVKDYEDCTLRVRCDGVPKPNVKWFLNGKEITNDERHTVTTEVGGQVDSQLDIKHFNASDSGKYKVVAFSVSGEAECQADITMAQIPPGFGHKMDRQKEVDEGEPLELRTKVDGSPIPTAKWFKDGVELSPNDEHVKQTCLPDGTVKLNIEHVTPGDCGAYKLLITNPSGEHMALCAVAVNPTPRKPSFSEELVDVKAVVGQPVQLQARVMAFPAPEVKWFKDGVPIRPSQAVNFINQPGGIVGLSIDSCRPEDAGSYSLTVTNKLGEVASKANVEIGQKERKPAFIAELHPTKVIEGFPVRLEVKVLGHPQPTIKWTHNGKEIVPDGKRVRVVSQPDGTHALLISEATPADAGNYGVIATNDKGETATNADLTVASREDSSSPQERPQFIHGLREVSGEEGQPLTVTAPFTANPVPQVTWTKDGKPLSPNERILLTCDGKRVGLEINPLEISDAGVYGVKLVNPLGEDSTEGKLNVRKVFQPPRFTQKFTDLQQLPTFDAKFPARITGIPAPEITWYKDNVPLKPSDKYSMKRDGDACCLYVRDLVLEDAGQYKCVAKNKEGEDTCEAALEVVDKIARKQKVEPPTFLKKIGDTEVFRGLSAKFTACATGTPEPDVEWFRNDQKIFPSDRIRIEQESTGLLRLTISGVSPEDVGTYRCRIFNPHGEESCTAQLVYDTPEPQKDKKPISEQYSDFDKMKRTGVPMPLADKPIISRMADRHLTLSWKPSIPHQPRFPVTYQVEMCEVPDGDWFTARTGLRSCVCDIRNLEPFRDYKFRVRVENKYGVSDPSPFAITHRAKLEPDPPKFIPYLEPGIDFRPETSPYFPKDFDIERPPHDGYAQAPKFLLQEYDSQYGVKGHNVNLFWFVYGYPKPKMEYFFNDEPIEIGGRYDWSYTRNGQATLFINKMLERDVGWYEAVATNEHGQARQRVRLELAEYPAFIRRPEETVVLQRRTARIEARVTGVPYPDIKWYKDWQSIAASSRIKMQFIEPDTHILVITDAILKDEGLYSVSARNVAGSVSSSAMLYVEESEHEYSARIREYPPRIKPSTKPFGDYYDLGDELGRGVQGVVYHAAERQSGRNYAAKIMHGHSELKPFMKNELDIMNQLNDRHLVRLYDAYEHDHTLALVTELAAGGELVRDRLLRSQGYTEREVAGYIRQLLRGLKHMHDNSVAHLGLTIGELLLSHAGSDELKICDFGLSRRIQLNKHAALDYGMPEFVAPEVANGEGVAFGADMWSVGIITYILLSGYSPFRCRNDRETLTKIREGKWEWHDEEWWSRFSKESRDFISKLLVLNWHDRMDVDTALSHPWLNFADKIYKDEYIITTDRLRNYYNLYRDWMSNAQCHTWFRRRPLSGAFDHPSKMVYPPGTIYTPEGTPERDRPSHERQPNEWDLKFKQWEHPDWEVSATSESHYQNGPDTYLLQLRDTQFPVRLREYMKVACIRSPGYSLSVQDTYDPRTPIIRERRRFTDIMDEEIDDERRERINNYGTESYTIRRLRHELGTRLDSYAEAQAFMESKKDGQLPFFREKPQVLPIQEGDQAQLSCFAVGDPKPSIQWFKNDMVIAEGQRIKIIEDEEGRSTLKFDPTMHHDIGFYKVVARNKVGQTVARTRIVEATTPDAPDSPTAAEISDTQILLRWKQPKYDGNSPVVCYSLQYREGDNVEWKTLAENIDHEFFVVRNLQPDSSYHFRLSSRNRIGWSEKGIPTELIKTKQSGAPKIEVSKAMDHLQQLTESGQEIVLYEDRPKLDYAIEENPIEWDTTTQNLSDRYSFISELWRGKFSTVVKGVDKTTDDIVVAKILEIRPETEVQVQREFNCIRKLRHERISNLLAAYQLPGASVATLILEKLQGADVLTYLSSCHDYNEQMVATIITQVLDGLQYLHWRGYCHLDLQPDNVVMSSVRSIQVKLIDFGSAHRVTKLGTSVPQVGDLEYKSPEIINDEAAYPQTDIWSVGVLAYILLSGVSPFKGADDAETKQNISFVRYRFEHLYKEITQEATRFLMWVFKKVPLKRPTAEECHEHRWLAHSDFIQRKRERAVFLGNRLREFAEEYHEKKAREASQTDILATFGSSPRSLARSNSITDELLTNFSSR